MSFKNLNPQCILVLLSRVPGAEDGLFSRCAVLPNTVLAFYNGIKLRGGEGDPNR